MDSMEHLPHVQLRAPVDPLPTLYLGQFHIFCFCSCICSVLLDPFALFFFAFISWNFYLHPLAPICIRFYPWQSLRHPIGNLLPVHREVGGLENLVDSQWPGNWVMYIEWEDCCNDGRQYRWWSSSLPASMPMCSSMDGPKNEMVSTVSIVEFATDLASVLQSNERKGVKRIRGPSTLTGMIFISTFLSWHEVWTT